MHSFLSLSAASITALSFSLSAQAASYSVSDTFIGDTFYQGFQALAIADPTQGRVNYVDTATAQRLNLTYAHGDTFVLRTDSTTTLSAAGPGRNSVRLSSNKKYGANSVIVADIRHMPQGCGTWPALWTFSDPWPTAGEIDILEGVNDQGPNAATLHTSPGCTQAAGGRPQTGNVLATDCDTNVNGNAGCGVQSRDATSYGPAFNNNGGGWYVMERTSTSISVWFWPRNAGNVPSSVSSGSSTIDTSTFGTPFAAFVNNSCDISSHFAAHNIIINLTLCGTWAGQDAIFQSAGCPGSCVDYVNNNPSAFTNAYFDFAALRVYQ